MLSLLRLLIYHPDLASVITSTVNQCLICTINAPKRKASKAKLISSRTRNFMSTTLSQANCREVFVQRDFLEGRGVRFASRFPVELEGKIDRQLFDYTIITLNRLYAEAEKGSCST